MDETSVGSSSFIPRRRELKELAALAFPVVTVQMGLVAMGVADTIMVGRVSARDLAAVALGNLYFFLIGVFGMGVLMSLDPLISQAFGANDRVAVARGMQRGLILALALGVFASLLLLPADPVLTALRQPADVIPIAAAYALLSIPGTFPFYGFVVLRQSLQAMGLVAPIVVTIVAANLVNLFLNWILIFGNLGAPALGAVGSSLASTLSRWFMAIALVAVAWPLLRPYLRPIRPEIFSLRPLLRMLGVGAPIGVQFQLEFGAFGVIGIMMGWMGTIPMAGHQVAINLASFTFMIAFGISQASAVLVGRGVGRADPAGARRAGGAGVLMGGVLMSLTAIPFLLFAEPIARFYTTDPEVVAIAAGLIPIAGIFQVFDGVQGVASGVLRGVADTRSPMLVNILGFWMIGMPVSYVLAFRLGAGPTGLWWGLAAGLAAVAVLLLGRVRIRLGRELRRVVIDEVQTPRPLRMRPRRPV